MKIYMLQPYPWYGTRLLGTIQTGQIIEGVELTEEKARLLIEEGFAREVE